MKKVKFFMVVISILFFFFPYSLQAIVLLNTKTKVKRKINKQRIQKRIEYAFFKKWDGNTLVTQSGHKYKITPSIKVDDHDMDTHGKTERLKRKIKLIYINNILKKVVIHP